MLTHFLNLSDCKYSNNTVPVDGFPDFFHGSLHQGIITTESKNIFMHILEKKK